MKRILKSITALSLSGAMILTSNTVVAQASTMDVYFNGEEFNGDSKPFVQKGVTYLPIRDFAEMFDVKVSFDNKTQTVKLEGDDRVVLLVVGKKEYSINGEKFTADAAPILKDGRTYLPLRVAGSAFDADIKYDKETESIYIEVQPTTGSETTYSENEVVEILTSYFNLTESEIESLTDEEISLYLEIYDEMLAMGLDTETMKAIEADTTELILSIVGSDEFTEFVEALLELEEFNAVIEDILSSENFQNYLDEILDSEYIVELTKALYELPEYEAYLEEIKTVPSYDALVKKYGEEIFTEQFNADVSIEEQLELGLELISDPTYMQFTLEIMELDSYIAYQEAMYELLNTSEFMGYIEEVTNSESLMLFVEEIEEMDSIYTLIDEVSTMPELYALMELYTSGSEALYEKYGLN